MRKALGSLLSLLLAALLLAPGLCPSAVSAESKGSAGSALPYTDVSPADWFYEIAQKAYRMELMDGVTARTFQPLGTLTRALFVDVLYRLSGAGPGIPQFRDVSSKDPFADAIGWAQASGIVSGGGDEKFRPSASLTRQEFFVMADRFLQYTGCELPASGSPAAPFSDQGEIASWARDSIERLRRAGLANGADGKVLPTRNTTRIEAAAIAVLMAEHGVSPLIGGYRLPQFSLYTDQPDYADLDQLTEKIKALTGASLPKADQIGPKTVVFTVDDTRPLPECAVREQDGVLTLAVGSKYALPYMGAVLEDLFSQTGEPIPEGYAGTLRYAIDDGTALPVYADLSLAGETDRNPLTYAAGEDVIFQISLLAANRLVSVPAFSYQYRTDDGITRSGTISGRSGQFVLTLPGCKEPGTAVLTVTPEGLPTTGADFIGTVVFDLSEIAPARPAPADFRQFWDSQCSKLMASQPREIAFETCEDHARSRFQTYDAVVSSPWDEVYLHITVPESAERRSLQIALVCQAYGFRSAAPEYREDAITVSVNAHSIENDRTPDYYEEKSRELDCWVDSGDTRESCYFLGMMMRDIQALRYVQDKFADLWDGKSIEASGISMGGYQALAVGALYDKVSSLSIAWPWMCDLAGGPAGRNDGWAPSWSQAGQYYDACYFAPYVKADLRSLTVGLGDYISPPSGIIAMYNALTVPKEAVFLQDGRHVSDAETASGSFSLRGALTGGDSPSARGCSQALLPPE